MRVVDFHGGGDCGDHHSFQVREVELTAGPNWSRVGSRGRGSVRVKLVTRCRRTKEIVLQPLDWGGLGREEGCTVGQMASLAGTNPNF